MTRTFTISFYTTVKTCTIKPVVQLFITQKIHDQSKQHRLALYMKVMIMYQQSVPFESGR